MLPEDRVLSGPGARSPCVVRRPGAKVPRRFAMGAIDLVTEIPGPRSKEILARKSRVVCDPLDIHVPVVINHGVGARFTDVDGNTWLDFSGGLGCQLVGYSHPKVVEAVQRRSEERRVGKECRSRW